MVYRRPFDPNGPEVTGIEPVTPVVNPVPREEQRTDVPVPSNDLPVYPFTTMSDDRFDTLRLIRLNNLGGATGEASIYASTDTSQGFYDINLKSIGVTGDLVLTETPTSVTISLKQPDVQPTFIQSGTNLNQNGGRVYKGVVGDVMEFRSLSVGSGLTLQQTADQILIGLESPPAQGDITGATNLGPAGQNTAYLFKDKVGTNLEFRSIYSSDGIVGVTLDSTGDQIVLSFNSNQISVATLAGTFPANRVSGLSPIATNADYNLLSNRPTIPATLNDLNNVSGTPVQGNVLTFSGSGWTPSAIPTPNMFAQVRSGSTTITPNSPTSELLIAGSNGVLVNANSATRTVTLALQETGILPGSYTNANLTVDQFGRVMAIANGNTGPTPLVDPMTQSGDMMFRNVNNITARLARGQQGQVLTIDNGVPSWRPIVSGGSVSSVGITGRNGVESSGGPITASGNITVGLMATGVAAGQYTAPTLRIDAYGRITHASNNVIVSGSRRINTSGGIGGGGDLTSDLTISLQPTGITAGSYSGGTIQVDEFGRILAITGGGSGGGGGGVSSVAVTGAGGINVTGSPITSSGTIALTLSNTGVTPGQYTNPTLQVNAQGRITSITDGGSGGGDLVVNGNIVMGLTGEPVVSALGGIFFVPASNAEMANTSHPINTQKEQGMVIFNYERAWLYFADGNGAAGRWRPMGYGTNIVANLPPSYPS